MGLDYLAGALHRSGFKDTEILDLDVQRDFPLERHLSIRKPRVVGITNMSFQTDMANSLASRIRNAVPESVIVKGGSHERFGYSTTLSLHTEVDACLVGEGEDAFPALCSAVSRGEWPCGSTPIPGLATRKSGAVSLEPPKSLCGSLDEYPPERLTYHQQYAFDIFEQRQTAQVLTSRGCNNACYYCLESVNGPAERYRSMESIGDELSDLARDGYEAIYFDDSTFTRNPERVRGIARLLRDHGMIWGCNTRVDCVTPELVAEMAAAGCVYIFAGIESGVPAVLKAMNKTRDVYCYLRSAHKVYRALRAHDVQGSVFLIFGGPKRIRTASGGISYVLEDDEDVIRSLEFAVFGLRPKYLSMNVLRLFPGIPFSTSPLFACLRPWGGKPIGAEHYDGRWYQKHALPDLRTRHEVYNAFEGRGSVVPHFMTPERCYWILNQAVDIVNRARKSLGVDTELVVGEQFAQKSLTLVDGQYSLVPFRSLAES